MYSLNLSIEIHTPAARVWRALCEPSEVVRWDSGVMEALDAPADYPRAGQHVKWRIRSGPFRLLHDRPVEVVREKLLRSRLTLGPYEVDEAYRLAEAPAGTQVELSVVLRAKVPVVGALLERLHGGPETRAGFEASLAGLKRYCEEHERDLFP